MIMNVIRYYLLFLFLMFGILSNTANALEVPELTKDKPVKIYGQVMKQNIDIGEPFDYEVTLFKLKDVNVKFDKLKKEQFKKLQLNDFKEETKELNNKGIQVIKQVYSLQPTDIENVEIPSIKAVMPDKTYKIPVIKLEPKSVLDKKAPLKEVNDIKPLEKFFIFSIWYVIIPLLVILAIVLIVFLLKKVRRHNPEAVVPEFVKDPHVLAFDELAKLKRMKLETQEDYKEFYSKLSEILKVYLEGRFRIPSVEKTTEEVLEQLLIISLNISSRSLIRHVLQESDMVKFAKYLPLFSEAFDSLKKVHDFVEMTKIDPSIINQEGETANV